MVGPALLLLLGFLSYRLSPSPEVTGMSVTDSYTLASSIYAALQQHTMWALVGLLDMAVGWVVRTRTRAGGNLASIWLRILPKVAVLLIASLNAYTLHGQCRSAVTASNQCADQSTMNPLVSAHVADLISKHQLPANMDVGSVLMAGRAQVLIWGSLVHMVR